MNLQEDRCFRKEKIKNLADRREVHVSYDIEVNTHPTFFYVMNIQSISLML